MAFVANQAFNETPNSILTTFTTVVEFEPGTVQVFQGGALKTNFTETDGWTLEFDAAPTLAAGTLLWSGELAYTPQTLLWQWTLTDLRAHYPQLTPMADAVLTAILQDAEYTVEGYVTAAIWADSLLETATNLRAQQRILRVIGQLVWLYAQQRGQVPGLKTAHSESFSGVKTYSDTYDTTATTAFGDERRILDQLLEWRDTAFLTDSGAVVVDPWGTGRFVSLLTNITEFVDGSS